MAASDLENQIEQTNWHWRNTMRPARFFALDARAAIPFIVLLFYFRPVTLFITFVVTTVFLLMERNGLTFAASLRLFRSWFVGQNRPAWMQIRHRHFIDYG